MSKSSSGTTAYETLMEKVRDGTFLPGDRLREEDVAAQLSLSRTPVREALRRLEAEGIVEHRPRIGAVIRQLGHAEVVELYEMRVVLEKTAAEFAAKHGVEVEIDALEQLNDELRKETQNASRAAALNQKFHRGIYLAGRNRFLLEAARSLNNALLLLGPTTLRAPDRIEEVAAQHADILSALRAGDAEAAGRAAEIHLTTSLRARLKETVD